MKEGFDGMAPLYGEGPDGHLDEGIEGRGKSQHDEEVAEKPVGEEKEQINEERRNFLRGATSSVLSATALGGVGSVAWLESRRNEEERERQLENMEGMSRLFLAEVEIHKELYRREDTEKSLLKKFDEKEEPELVELIKSDEVRSTIEVARFFSAKPVRGAEEFARSEFVQSEEVDFPEMSVEKTGRQSGWKETQRYLRPLLEGLCAQESLCDDNKKSPAGASGIFQLMPGTVEGMEEYREYVIYGPIILKDKEGIELIGEDGKPLTEKDENGKEIIVPVDLKMIPLKIQVEIVGKHFASIYDDLYDFAGEDLEHVKSVFFPNEGFEEYFMTPLVINAYNAGAKRVSEAVKLLKPVFPNREVAESIFDRDPQYLGYDVFYNMGNLAMERNDGFLKRYGKESREYVVRVFAMKQLLVDGPLAPLKSPKPKFAPEHMRVQNSDTSEDKEYPPVPKPRPTNLG